MVNSSPVDREITVINDDSIPVTDENTEDFQERWKEAQWIGLREMGKIGEAGEDRIQNTTLTAIGTTITPRIELAVRTKDTSSEPDAARVTAKSKLGKHGEIGPSFENVSDRMNRFHG